MAFYIFQTSFPTLKGVNSVADEVRNNVTQPASAKVTADRYGSTVPAYINVSYDDIEFPAGMKSLQVKPYTDWISSNTTGKEAEKIFDRYCMAFYNLRLLGEDSWFKNIGRGPTFKENCINSERFSH